MVSIPLSRWQSFKHTKEDGRRLGQHFYDHMELDKIVDPTQKVWCDQLYNQPSDHTARQMILVNIDHGN